MRWWTLVKEDFKTVFERDPATQKAFHVLTLHTGFWAVAAYRVRHTIFVHSCRCCTAGVSRRF